jgi:prolyl oligopeptidase
MLLRSLSLILASFLSIMLTAQIKYPTTAKVDTVDTYFGNQVPDPYRWLEDDRSAQTGAWVDAQNQVTFNYLDKIPYRKSFAQNIEKLFNYPKYSSPYRKGDYYYFYLNSGLQNQSVLYRQKGLNGKPELVLDPNTLSADGTTRLMAFSINKKATHAVIALSQGGSDWQTYQVRDLATGKNLADKIEWVKVSSIAWHGDGFFYSRYPTPSKSALSSINVSHQLYYHKLGTEQSQDRLVFSDAADGQRFITGSTSEDERYLFLYISDRSKGFDGNALHIADLKENAYNFKPIVSEVSNSQYSVVDAYNNQIIIQTNHEAPNYKLLSVSTSKPAIENASVLVAETENVMEGVNTGGGKLFIDYLKDVTTRTYVYNLQGQKLSEVKYPSLGSGTGIGGNADDKTLFYVFTSFTYPPTIYQYDVATGKSKQFRKPNVLFSPGNYVTKQVFFTSKDGTKVPMFIIHKKDIKLNGNNPTLLYGYGGFKVSLTPSFSASRIAFLNAGGIYVQANLRGGDEYGEAWHQAGMLLNKQNVFDDCIAAAEYLIENKYCSAKTLALQGGSNGGLLVGAVINQRPELFSVAIPQVGVMDMLRFHKFTIGHNWIADYGSSEASEEEFQNLFAYSPIHNVKQQNYPATLITTADHDDRVVPAHSFKYAATMQAVSNSKQPILIRIDKNSGHGASNTKKNIETTADIYSFIFYNMGITPNLK